MKKLLLLLTGLLFGSTAIPQTQPEVKAGSVVVGNPTGGNEGVGTINATGVYVNGTPVSGGGTGTVTSVSVNTANGLSGTVANPTTTPTITLNASGLQLSQLATQPPGTVLSSVDCTTSGQSPVANTAPCASTFNATSATSPFQISGKTVLNSILDNGAQYQTVVGYLAGYGMSTSTIDTVCVGYESCGGYAGGGLSGSEITALGDRALANAVSSTGVTAIGVYAVQAETSGTNLVCVGGDCMRNTLGITNTAAVGNSAFRNAIPGSNYDVAMGVAALSGQASAQFTGYISSGSGSASAGTVLTVISTQIQASPNGQALASGMAVGCSGCSTGVTITSLGTGTGGTGTYNLSGSAQAVGYNSGAGISMLAGSQPIADTAFGDFALGGNITVGSDNTAIGYDTLSSMTTGGNNVVVGSYAGASMTGGFSNVLVGSNSGINLSGTDFYNVCIGYNTCTNSGSLNSTVVIGSNINPSQASGAVNINGSLLGFSVAPTLTSGWGTSPTNPTQTSTFSFSFTTTATPGTTGVIGLPTSPLTGWNCTYNDQTSNVTARQSANTATSSTATWSSAPSASDLILVKCAPY